MDASAQTRDSFKQKWQHNPQLAFSTTLNPNSEIQSWILTRNGFPNLDTLRQHLRGRRRILDAGCGNGRISMLLSTLADPDSEIIAADINIEMAQQNLSAISNIKCIALDLDQQDVSHLGKFDFIYCQEVLHHLKNPSLTFANLSSLLHSGGEIAIYVYGLKAPIREFSDEYVRDKISSEAFSDSLSLLQGITELGKTLRGMNVSIDCPEIGILDIPKGVYSLHEFIYNYFLKCFYNEAMSFDENLAIAADWFHPQQATKHTLVEVLEWFKQSNLQVQWKYKDAFGITVRGTSR